MPRKSCHKAVKLTCGDEYDAVVKTAKSKYHEDVNEVFRYENGAIGVFLKSGKFRFVQGSNPETLAKLRSKRKSSSKKGGSQKRKSSKKQRGGENDEIPVTGGKRRSSKKQRGGEQTLDNLMTKLDNLTTTNEVSTTDMPTQDGGAKKKQLNLKNAVQLLRKYYSEKFRK
jgi:hypothetical protein